MSKGFKNEPAIDQEIQFFANLAVEERKLYEPYEWEEYDDDGEFLGMSSGYDDLGDSKPVVNEEIEAVRKAECLAWWAGYDAGSAGLTQSDRPVLGKAANYSLHGWKLGSGVTQSETTVRVNRAPLSGAILAREFDMKKINDLAERQCLRISI